MRRGFLVGAFAAVLAVAALMGAGMLFPVSGSDTAEARHLPRPTFTLCHVEEGEERWEGDTLELSLGRYIRHLIRHELDYRGPCEDPPAPAPPPIPTIGVFSVCQEQEDGTFAVVRIGPPGPLFEGPADFLMSHGLLTCADPLHRSAFTIDWLEQHPRGVVLP